jgi:hypothetical protein
MSWDLSNKVERFAALLESDHIKYLIRSDLACSYNISDGEVKIIPGKKYTKVDIGHSGRYMIDGDSIYGIKAYGVINRVRYYGKLDDIENYFWGNYFPKEELGRVVDWDALMTVPEELKRNKE